eukprot:GHVP01041170.1.p1 GENE.GHVP01041170.1~~GHVP01041170.1.p1  ORF type:complete len:100 (-),score=1.69 GHVP01041170.1:522-821(-)
MGSYVCLLDREIWGRFCVVRRSLHGGGTVYWLWMGAPDLPGGFSILRSHVLCDVIWNYCHIYYSAIFNIFKIKLLNVCIISKNNTPNSNLLLDGLTLRM